MKSAEPTLKQNFEGLGLPVAASEWLCDLFAVIQLFDDVADGGRITRDDLSRVVWASLVGMVSNSFWAANAATLTPVIAAQVMKWEASDLAEVAGKHDAKSFVWRAGYYDVVLMVCRIVHGAEWTAESSALVMNMYGESYDDYMKEFEHA